MTAVTSSAAEAGFCAALFCAATVAWTLTDRRGPGRARLMLATGSAHADPAPLWLRRAQRFGATLRARFRKCSESWTPGRAEGRAGAGARFGQGLARLCTWAGQAGRAWWCLPAGALAGLWGESPVPVALGAVAVPLVSRFRRKRRAQRAAEDTETAVIDLCAAAAGELRSGRLPGGALLAAGAGRLGREGAALLAAARFGGDVPTALHRAARLPGAGGLRGAAACWQVYCSAV